MIRSGMTSVTLRHLSWQRVLHCAAEAGLSGIEWGGDIHVPPGDIELAQRVKNATAAAGLSVLSYGSYYRVGCSLKGTDGFTPLLASAVALEAPVIRVWAGDKGSQEADAAWLQRVAEDTERIVELAAKEEIQVAYEFHGGTLTDSGESAVRLLRQVKGPIRTYWQPSVGLTVSQRLAELEAVLPWLICLHVFHWRDRERLPLAEGEEEWAQYLALLPADDEFSAVLEFVKGDKPEQLRVDAATLHDLLEKKEAAKKPTE